MRVTTVVLKHQVAPGDPLVVGAVAYIVQDVQLVASTEDAFQLPQGRPFQPAELYKARRHQPMQGVLELAPLLARV